MVASVATSTVKTCLAPGLTCTQSTPNVVGNALQTGTFTYCCSTELCNTDTLGQPTAAVPAQPTPGSPAAQRPNSASSFGVNVRLALLATVAGALCMLCR